MSEGVHVIETTKLVVLGLKGSAVSDLLCHPHCPHSHTSPNTH